MDAYPNEPPPAYDLVISSPDLSGVPPPPQYEPPSVQGVSQGENDGENDQNISLIIIH